MVLDAFLDDWKSHPVLQLLWKEKPFSLLTLLNGDRNLLCDTLAMTPSQCFVTNNEGFRIKVA